MALLNRDKDVTEQDVTVSASAHAAVLGAGGTAALFQVPWPCQLVAAAEAAHGLSGAPNHSLWAYRFVAGAGVTNVAIAASMVAQDWGTSGSLNFSCAIAASFLLQANDLIVLRSAGSNTAVTDTEVTLVVRALQDTKSHFGQQV